MGSKKTRNKDKRHHEVNENLQKEKDKMKAFFKTVANPNCSHCGGIGQKGFNIFTKEFVICQCVRKNYKKHVEKEKNMPVIKEETKETKEKKQGFFQKILGHKHENK